MNGFQAFVRKHLQEGGGLHDHFVYSITPKSTPSTNCFTQDNVAQFQFDITAVDLHLIDGDSVILRMDVAETGGVSSVTPAFAEAHFNRQRAISWQLNGTEFLVICVDQIVLEPALWWGSDEYKSYCNLVNHNEGLAANSTTPIQASGTISYYVRLPTPFPRNEGFYLGALYDKKLSCVFYCANAVTAGSGTYACNQVLLYFMCHKVPSDEKAEWARQFNHISWPSFRVSLNLPASQTTLTSTSYSPIIKYDNFKDKFFVFLLRLLHSSRSLTNNAFWNLVVPDPQSGVDIISQDGVIIKSSQGVPATLIKFFEYPRQLGNTKLNQTNSSIAEFINPDTLHMFRTNIINSVLGFNGEESDRFLNFGANAQALYDDIVGWEPVTIGINDGAFALSSSVTGKGATYNT